MIKQQSLRPAFQTISGSISIDIQTILLCEAAGKETIVHCVSRLPNAHIETKPVFHLLADIQKRLSDIGVIVCDTPDTVELMQQTRTDALFVRCHKSMLLNIAQVGSTMEKQQVQCYLMVNGFVFLERIKQIF